MLESGLAVDTNISMSLTNLVVIANWSAANNLTIDLTVVVIVEVVVEVDVKADLRARVGKFSLGSLAHLKPMRPMLLPVVLISSSDCNLCRSHQHHLEEMYPIAQQSR